MQPKVSLEVVQVREPCPADWESMKGNSTSRFCAGCQKTVHDLLAMPRAEAERLICVSAGLLCIRMRRAANGAVMTLHYQPDKRLRRRWVWPFTAIATLGASVGAFAFFRPTPKPTIIMGDMYIPSTRQVIGCTAPSGNGSYPVPRGANNNAPATGESAEK